MIIHSIIVVVQVVPLHLLLKQLNEFSDVESKTIGQQVRRLALTASCRAPELSIFDFGVSNGLLDPIDFSLGLDIVL